MVNYFQNISVEELSQKLAWPLPGASNNYSMKKLLTLYHGTCIQYNMDLKEACFKVEL